MDIQLSKIKVQFSQPKPRVLFHLARLEIKAGEKVLLQGPSGRGKTTLLHLIAGLFLPSEGDVRVGGRVLHSMSDESRCRFRLENYGIVFQRLNLLEQLTARENVLLGFGNGQDHTKADQAADVLANNALSALGLDPDSQILASRMSVGEQQRVAIARAIAAKPKVILADEPTSSLDEKNAFAVIDALLEGSRQKNHNATVVVVSHDQRIASRFGRILNFTELVT